MNEIQSDQSFAEYLKVEAGHQNAHPALYVLCQEDVNIEETRLYHQTLMEMCNLGFVYIYIESHSPSHNN